MSHTNFITKTLKLQMNFEFFYKNQSKNLTPVTFESFPARSSISALELTLSLITMVP